MKKLALITLLALSPLAQAVEYEAVRGHKYSNHEIYFTNSSTGKKMDSFYSNGKIYVAGNVGDNYEINLCSHGKRMGRQLYVVSVDGLNVINGEPAKYNQPGYVVSGGQCSKIKGWRKNMNEEAKFVLTASSGSYAARTNNDTKNLGVIGLAIFNEDIPVQIYEESHQLKTIPPAPTTSAPTRPPETYSTLDGAMAKQESFRLKKQEQIGTGHGERITSQARDTDFKKASNSPSRVVQFYYDSYENLVAKGIITVNPDLPNAFPGEEEKGFAPDPKY